MKKLLLFLILLVPVYSPRARAETLDLNKFLDLVMEHSKDIKLAEQERHMARMQKKEAVSTALPKVALEAGYTRNLSDYYMYFDMSAFDPQATGVAKAPVKRDNEFSTTIALQQTLFSSSVGSAIKAARQYSKLTDLVYEATEDAIKNAAKNIFYQSLLLEKVWEVNLRAEENAHENYMMMRNKYENGVISEFELLQAEVRWKNAVPVTAESLRNYNLALNNMKNWAGIAVEEDIVLQGSFDEVPAMPEGRDLESVLTKRPDFNALLWEEKLRNTNVTATKGSFLPTLKGTIAYAYSAQSNEFKLDEENNLYFAGVTLSWPIFTGGYRCAQVQKAKIDLTKTRIKIDQTREDIFNELSNVRLRLKEAHARIASAEAILKTASKAFKIAEVTSKNGLATQLELKDARIAYDQATLNNYAAKYDFLAAYFDWEKAIGSVQ